MTSEAPGDKESLELHKKQLGEWGLEITTDPRATPEAGFSPDDNKKIQEIVDGAVRAGAEATVEWSRSMFTQAVNRRANLAGPRVAALVKKLLEGDATSLSTESAEEPPPATLESEELSTDETSFKQEFLKYSLDPKGELTQGEVVILEATEGDERWTFFGADGETAVFGKIENDKLVIHRQPLQDFYQESGETEETEPATEHQSAQAAPPEAIASVAVDVASADDGEAGGLSLEAQAEKESVEKLNALKAKIDEQHEIIRATRDEKKDDDASKKKVAAARRMLDQLHQQAKDLAIGLVDGAELFDLIKPADDVTVKSYESKIPRKTPREDRRKMEKELTEKGELTISDVDAFHEAGRRKNDFAGALGAKGVTKDIAYDLYREFVGRAKEVEWLEGELKEGRNDVLTGPRARKILEWHGISARQPESVLVELSPWIENYNTIPPKAERPKREPAGGAETKKRPVEKIFESIAAGQEIEDRTLRSFLNDERTTAEERDQLQAELARREEVKGHRENVTKEEKSKKTSPLLHRVIEAILGTKGETVPLELLAKFSNEPMVASYLAGHPEALAAVEALKINDAPNEGKGEIAAPWPWPTGGAKADVVSNVEGATPASSAEKERQEALEGHYERARLRALEEGKARYGKIKDQGLSPEDAGLIMRMLEDRGVINAEGNILHTPPPSSTEAEAVIKAKRREQLAEYQTRWNEKTESVQKEVIRLCKNSFQPNGLYLTRRTDQTIEPWTLVAIGEDGTARMAREALPEETPTADLGEGGRWMAKDILLEELTELNPGIFLSDSSADTEKAHAEAGTTAARELTPGGKKILASVDAGGIPLYINERFKSILEANGIPYRTDAMTHMTPDEAVEALRKIDRDWNDSIPTLTDVVEDGGTNVAEGAPKDSSETLESLTKKAEIVEKGVFVSSDHDRGGIVKTQDDWNLVTEFGMQLFREALIAANPQKFDEVRFHARDAEYLKNCALWLHHQYETVVVPALEKMKAERAPIVPPGDILGLDREDLFDDAAPTSTHEAKDTTPINHGVLKQFEKKFGIKEDDLQGIELFERLSVGQQLLVLKNLEQIVLTDIKKEAQAQQKDEWGKTPWYKKAWKQLYSAGMNPEHRIAELEKEMLAKHRGGADEDPAHVAVLADNLANLEQLAKVAAEGPEVNIGANGELEMVYVSGRDLFESNEDPAITAEQKKLFEEFNMVASEFAKFPCEWGYETEQAGMIERWSRDRRRYEATKARYVEVRASMLQLHGDRFFEGYTLDPEKDAMHAMNAIDERIELNQLFSNHPDAEAALAQVEDQSAKWFATKEFWKSKGMFIAGGVLARFGAIAISGGIIFPVIGVIGAGVGGLIGTAEGKKLMKAKRADGRMSEEDMREEIEYGVPTFAERIKEAEEELKMPKITSDQEFALQEELTELRTRLTTEGEIPKERQKQKRQIKEFTDATFFVDRIDRLTEKLFYTDGLDERAALEEKIAQTTTLMSERFKRGMINFGGSSLEAGDERKGGDIANRLSFIQALARGHMYSSVDQGALEAEIERITGLRQSTIEDKRKQDIRKAAAKSAIIRGAFALTGAGIAQSIHEIVPPFSQGEAEMVANAIRNRPQGTVNIPQSIFKTQSEAEANALADYMRDWNPFTRARTLEVMGLSKEQADAKIAEALARGHGLSGAVGSGAKPPAPTGERSQGVPSYADAPPDSANPEAFNATNFDKNIPSVVGRVPSTEELAVLRSTGGVDNVAQANMAQHNALIEAVSKSKTPLSHEEIEAILARTPRIPLPVEVQGIGPNEEVIPWNRVEGGAARAEEMARLGAEANKELGSLAGSGGTSAGAVVAAGRELVQEPPGSELLPYKVLSGDNFTQILKTNISELKNLSPRGQENAIQNLLKSLSPEEKTAIGLGDDPDKLAVDQTLDLNKVVQLLHEKKIGGEDLIERAAHLSGAVEQASDFSHTTGTIGAEYSPAETDRVREFIQAARGSTNIPEELARTQAVVNANAYAEYMNDTDATHRVQLLETVGMTQQQMEENIARVLVSASSTAAFVGATVAARELSSKEAQIPWENLDPAGKITRAEVLSDQYIAEGVNKLFIKGPFEEWPKEWLLSRGRNALELLSQTKDTDPRVLLPGIKEIPVGHEWFVVEKLQNYMKEEGITREKGFIPNEKETVQDFLKRAFEEKVMRDGPLAKHSVQTAVGGVMA